MSFPNMIEIIPEGQQGNAKIKHVLVSQKQANEAHHRNILFQEGDYCQLFVKGQLVMSDTPYERNTNYEFERHAHRRVLIAGLGLGMIIKPILDYPDVEYAKVIEKYQDVIDLVLPHIKHEKLEVVCADIFEWKPEKYEKYNTIYFDIWPDICTDNLKDMKILHNKAKYWVDRTDSNRWVESWMRSTLKSHKQREDKERKRLRW